METTSFLLKDNAMGMQMIPERIRARKRQRKYIEAESEKTAMLIPNRWENNRFKPKQTRKESGKDKSQPTKEIPMPSADNDIAISPREAPMDTRRPISFFRSLPL